MKNLSRLKPLGLALICIILNICGRLGTTWLSLPFWLDSLGTMIASAVLGPVWGAVTGISVNVCVGLIFTRTYLVYSLTSVCVAVVTSFCARRGWFNSLFGTLSAGFVVTLCSVIVSTPLNWIYFSGYTSNMWGDGVIDMMLEWGISRGVCFVVGEFYVDFLDKLIVVLIVYAILKLRGRFKGKKAVAVSMIVAIVSLSCVMDSVFAEAGEEEFPDFDTFVQTIYNGENGLPGGMANDIAQTDDGVIYIGTYGGLYRYNGRMFELMKELETVKSVNCLMVDSLGRLWIGTNGNGLTVYYGNRVIASFDESDGLPSNVVRCVTEAGDGSYYVGTSDSMVIMRIDDDLHIAGVIDEVKYANSISVRKDGVTAVVTNDGDMFMLESGEFVISLNRIGSGVDFSCCRWGIDDVLYVGTTGGEIDCFEYGDRALGRVGTIRCGTLNNIKSITTYDDETYICADNGAGYLRDGEFYCINTNKFNSSIDNMIIDYQGNLWFTSSRLGVLKLSESVFTEVYSKVGLEDNVVNCVTFWNNFFYYGTDSGLDASDATLSTPVKNYMTDLFSGIRIRCLYVDSSDRLWIATSGSGIFRISASGEVKTFDSSGGTLGDKFRMIVELFDGTIAATGDFGITFIRDDSIIATLGTEDGLTNPKVLCLVETASGTLLAGTDGNGIAVINDFEVTGMIESPDGLCSEIILRLAVTDGGVLVVTGSGLCFLDENLNVKCIDNFPYNNNYYVVEGKDGTLFIPSSAGLYVVNKDELLEDSDDMDCLLLGTRRGLKKSLTPNSWSYTDDKGNLYLPEGSGVVMLNMQRYDIIQEEYRMLLNTIMVDGIECPMVNDTITIPRGAKMLEFTPEVMNYSVNDPYVSAYLEGFDEQPRILRQSELAGVVYTNIPAGEYVFRLSVLDRNMKVVAEKDYMIVKEMEIYDHGWFKIYVLFVFSLTIIYLTWMIFRTQVQRTLELSRRELELARQQVKMSNEAIITIARTVDARDKNTSEHSLRVSEYSVLIGEYIGLSKEELEELRRTALLHDIGKIGIPDAILNKPSRLTDDEYAIMKSHVDLGAEILGNFTSVKNIVEGAMYHHERYDGRGYQRGLKGAEIPLNARIIGIADAFDAMTANRVYRQKLDFSVVLGELEKGRGTQFDPVLVDALLKLINSGIIKPQ